MAGDGSIQFNIQELQILKQYQLPIIVFVLNNNGYLSIRASQQNFFKELTGESPASGVTFPDIVQVAKAYGLKAMRLNAANFETGLKVALESKGPLVCEVILDPDQSFEPKVSSKQLPDGRIVSAPMEDMFPFLPREELLENLLIPPMEI
jgi:acetolactate synthase-1/2/3 large subunit